MREPQILLVPGIFPQREVDRQHSRKILPNLKSLRDSGRGAVLQESTDDSYE
jgi:hypothetical protein